MCSGPVQHGLHQAEGFFRDELEERSERLKSSRNLSLRCAFALGWTMAVPPFRAKKANNSSQVVPLCLVWSTMGSTLTLCQKMRTIIKVTACESPKGTGIALMKDRPSPDEQVVYEKKGHQLH